MARKSRANGCIIALCCAICASLSCNTTPAQHAVLDAQFLKTYPLPDGAYGQVAWLDSETLIVQYAPVRYGELITEPKQQLWSLAPDASNLAPYPLPVTYDNQCTYHIFHYPSRLPNGQLGYSEGCIGDPEGLKYRVMEYDPVKKVATQLLDYEFTGIGLAWNKDMSLAIASDGRGVALSEKLAWFKKESWENVALDMGISFGASWSPDETQIAFIGSPTEYDSPYRIKPYGLYIMDSNNPKQPQLILDNVSNAAPIWSSDGQWLLFSGKVNESERGLYALNISTRKPYFLIKGRNMTQPVWSPDFSSVALLRGPYPLTDESGKYVVTGNELLIIDLQSVLEQLEANP